MRVLDKCFIIKVYQVLAQGERKTTKWWTSVLEYIRRLRGVLTTVFCFPKQRARSRVSLKERRWRMWRMVARVRVGVKL